MYHIVIRELERRLLVTHDFPKGLTHSFLYCRVKAGYTTNHYGKTQRSSPSSSTPWMLIQFQERTCASSHTFDGYRWEVTSGVDLQANATQGNGG